MQPQPVNNMPLTMAKYLHNVSATSLSQRPPYPPSVKGDSRPPNGLGVGAIQQANTK